MDESFPERPALFLDFVLPSRSKDLFLNLWIAEPHTSTPRLHSLEDPNVLCKGASYANDGGGGKIIIEMVRWLFAETLRVFWSGVDREQVAKAIRELLTFDVPCIGTFEDVIMVQRTDLSAEQEILVLLHYAGEQGFSRTEVGKYAKVSPACVTTALKTLSAPDVREVIKLPSGKHRLTDLGSKRIREKMPDKLLLT